MRLRFVGLLAVASAGKWRTKPWLWKSLSVAPGPVIFGWAAGSGIWSSQDTDVPATLGSQPGLLLPLIPIFGCHSHLIHIPMSTLHNLPQTLTAWELGKGKEQLMSRDRETKGEGKQRWAGSRKPPTASSRQHSIKPPGWDDRACEPPWRDKTVTPEAPSIHPVQSVPEFVSQGGFGMMCRRDSMTTVRTLRSSSGSASKRLNDLRQVPQPLWASFISFTKCSNIWGGGSRVSWEKAQAQVQSVLCPCSWPHWTLASSSVKWEQYGDYTQGAHRDSWERAGSWRVWRS